VFVNEECIGDTIKAYFKFEEELFDAAKKAAPKNTTVEKPTDLTCVVMDNKYMSVAEVSRTQGVVIVWSVQRMCKGCLGIQEYWAMVRWADMPAAGLPIAVSQWRQFMAPQRCARALQCFLDPSCTASAHCHACQRTHCHVLLCPPPSPHPRPHSLPTTTPPCPTSRS
jgi:hypothetical protein